MRQVVVAAVLLAGCSSDDAPSSFDGGVDAPPVVDAPSSDAVDADLTPGPLDGTWTVAWTCTNACEGVPPRPALTYSRHLAIAGGSLAWSDERCSECSLVQSGSHRDSCLDVAAAVEGIDDRMAFALCSTGPDVFELDLTVRRSGGPDVTTIWRAVGSRD